MRRRRRRSERGASRGSGWSRRWQRSWRRGKIKVCVGGTFSSTAIEIIKWVKKIAVAQAKVTHILRPGKASEKTPKGVITPSLCEISQNASRKTSRCPYRAFGRHLRVQ
jgi:hypothetical protein